MNKINPYLEISNKYESMKNNIKSLYSNLDIKKDIYGEYDDKQKLMQKTYIVFSHSEFEFFIEEICEICVDISLKYFKKYKISNEILISLCHHYPIDRESFIKSPKYCESFDPIRVIEDTVNFL